MEHLIVAGFFALLLLSELGSVWFFWLAEAFAEAPNFSIRKLILVPVPGYVGHLLFAFALRALKQRGIDIPVAQAYLGLVGTALILTSVFAFDPARGIYVRASGELTDPLFWLCLVIAFAGLGGAKI
jgi:hypothetical protein